MRQSRMRKGTSLALVIVIVASVVGVDAVADNRQRSARYVTFDPPKIIPEADEQTVRAGETYHFRCEGATRGVSWRLPTDATDDLRSRVDLVHRVEAKRSKTLFVSELTINRLSYLDTGTFICTYNGTRDTNSIDNSTRVHLYVDDGKHLLKHTGVDFVQLIQSSTFILPCQPTRPDVNVTLVRSGWGVVPVDNDVVSFNPRFGFRISPVTRDEHSGEFTCVATSPQSKEPKSQTVIISVLTESSFIPPPYINQSLARHIALGDTFELVCSVTVDVNVLVELTWATPNNVALAQGRVIASDQTSRNLSLGVTQLIKVEKSLRVTQASLDDQGLYECRVVDHSGNSKKTSDFVRILEREEPFLLLYPERDQKIEREVGTSGKKDEKVQFVVEIDSFPAPRVAWYGPNGQPIPDPNHPYPSNEFVVMSKLGQENRVTALTINEVNLKHAGTYRCVVTNGKLVKEKLWTLVVRAPPKITVKASVDPDYYHRGQEYSIKCNAEAHPRPTFAWLFRPCSNFTDCDRKNTRHLSALVETRTNAYTWESKINIVASESGHIICQACNRVGPSAGCAYKHVPFFVSDIEDGFDVHGPKKVVEGEHIKLRCSATVDQPKQIQWFKHTIHGEVELSAEHSDDTYKVYTTSTKYSISKELIFSNVSIMDRGRYICKALMTKTPHEVDDTFTPKTSSYTMDHNRYYNDASAKASRDESDSFNRKERSIDLTVLPLIAPEFTNRNMVEGQTVVKSPEDGLRLECGVSGRPQPEVTWTLNHKPLQVTENTTRVQLTQKGSVVLISYLTHEYEGLYECRAANKVGEVKASQVVLLQSTVDNDTLYSRISYPVVIAVAVALVMVLVVLTVVSLCYSRRCSKLCCCCCCSGKSPPPSPPTPRLKQYELPFDHTMDDLDLDLDDCRQTLTSRDGSISPYAHRAPASLISSSHCHCHYSPCPSSSAMGTLPHMMGASRLFPKCSICDFSAQTLPLNRMATLHRYDLKHQQQPMAPIHSTLARPGSASPTMAPRLSAEF